MDAYRRKTPEELLSSIYKMQAGRLKVYIGAVNGSGKTYHMLREGQALKRQGIDVVACAVSTMRRPETVEQLAGLERIPSIHWINDKGASKKDLNLKALLDRNPEVVLVDALAHRNRPGAQYGTRLEDIRCLLGKGISVIATVNAYELEGITELAYRLTGIEAEETVPADTLDLADEVRLIDVSPETILARLHDGSLADLSRDGSGFLQKGNIGKLRELALRRMAEGVNESLEKHREKQGRIGPSGASERILVSAQYHWNGSIHIRRGQQIAKRLGGELKIVTLANPRRKLSKEEEQFKRSMAKLADKIGATIEELPMKSRRLVPRTLVRYAMIHNVTRIVLGHSKQSFWQDFRRGSIADGILRKTKNIDVFFVADRADYAGERVLPAKRVNEPSPPSDAYRRLSQEEIERKIEQIKRGRLKVYIGAAPGVGKTYMMLREGNDLLRKKIDVVIGLLETHGREETSAQIVALETLPRSRIDYKGTKLEEMDVQAILRRNPEAVLIDELAHTNVPGSANKKRYEDVLQILEAGISVIATMNVQHLESLNDAVEQMTGVRVRETVPDSILRLADEVELIDVAPSALRQRLREGKVYARDKVDQALDHFFQTGNLIALREMALRELADDVDERLEAWERGGSLRGPWNKRESIFVCVSASRNADRLIRRGFRIAHRLKAEWHVSYVRPVDGFSEEVGLRMKQMRDLTERLGGRFNICENDKRWRVADVLLERAAQLRATQLIVGQSGRRGWSPILRKSVVQTLLRRGRHMDVLVVADYDPNVRMED
ncbi:universal stress protein [Cohnella phaseoli]|uniref:Two-component system sensor histidine kinase KdpD n=1 Tax=Cohnella phaseoli TaxID=456490 RepID=A0A3D9HZE0_9BACL|nr:universal stress protein [Cohnella phaseoli]RED54898.1 two-component system sensor histidine kinase KdpD [Cohnella phaseoli]